jgi:hypothetical protein
MAGVDPFVSIICFIVIFIGYSYYKYSKNGEITPGANVAIFAFLVICQGFINLGISSSICQGAAQPVSALVATLLPWILVLGLLKVLLYLFPGWLIPFENTFGYIFVTIVTDISDVFNDVLTPHYNIQAYTNSDSSIPKSNELDELEKLKKRDLGRALEQLYTDQSIVLNELNMDNLDDFWKDSTESQLIQTGKDDKKEKIKNFILMKSIVGEFVWLILTGFLIVSISYNYLINAGCTYTQDQQRSRQEILLQLQKEANDKAKEADKDLSEVRG